MNDAVVWDTLRAMNAALSLAVLIGMAARWRYWRGQDPAARLLLGALGVLSAAGGYSSLEAAVQHGVPGGPRVLVVTIALAWTAVALVLARPRKDQR